MSRSKKDKIRVIRGSLASRILLIAMIFLVLPLLALSFLLYAEDGRVKAENNLFTLGILVRKKVEMVETVIKHERDFLSGVAYLLLKVEKPEQYLRELARREWVSALFHVKNTAGHYICDLASSSEYQGKDYSELMHASKSGVYLVAMGAGPMFYITRSSNDGSEGWVSVLSLERFMQFFPVEKNELYPTSTSLLLKDGLVISSTDTRLIGKKLGKEGHFHFEGEKYIAINHHVPATNFSLLISAPHKINFVDIPFFVVKVIIILALIVIVGGGGAIWLTSRLSKPLKRLIRVMYKVGKGDLTERFATDSMGFEFNTIGEIFNETVDSLLHHMDEAEQERVEKETYATELLIGEEVQSSILPKTVPDFPGVDIAVRFISAKEVGGDFYDFLADDKLMISIADTSGKGISACLYSLSVRSMLRSYGEIHQELDVIVNETNNLFCLDTGDTGVFVTAFVAFFDPKTRVLHYTNCGHFPALCMRKGKVDKLTTAGMALGVIPFDQVITDHAKLEVGDLIVLYTDGIVEAHNDKQELFGEERLIECLQSKKDLSPKQMVDEIIEEVAMFAEGAPQHDDLTLLVMRVTP